MTSVERRIVLHFPGFEPLDAEAHRARYARAAAQSGPLYGLEIDVGARTEGAAAPAFEVAARSGDRRIATRIHVFDYAPLIARINGRPVALRFATGFLSALRVILEGGLNGYVRHGWRFALFFLFPFLATLIALGVALLVAALPVLLGWTPWHLLWSAPLGGLLFAKGFLPLSERWHVLHLFGDWDLALALAHLRDPELLAWLARAKLAAKAALAAEADEIVVSSHSMGSGMAALVLGAVLDENPDALQGRRVVFLTLGGAILQSALLRSAKTLRANVGRIAHTQGLIWIEVQCLNDVVHFYRSKVVAACGHADAPQARLAFIRVKHMLTAERHKRIRSDPLRVHRQYVLGSDRRSAFDFAILTAGPAPAASFVEVKADRADAAARPVSPPAMPEDQARSFSLSPGASSPLPAREAPPAR